MSNNEELSKYEYFRTENGVLYHGDCLDILKLIDCKVDLILTDPPYNISQKKVINRDNINSKTLNRKKTKHLNYNFGNWDFFTTEKYLLFIKRWTDLIIKIVKESTSLYMWAPKSEVSFLEKILSEHFKIRSTLVWCKTNPVPQIFKVGYMSSTEFCIFATKNKGRKHYWNIERGQRQSYWVKPICQGKERTSHPTQKRLDIIEDMILQSSKKDDIVIDTFAGSGTIGIACEKFNRKYILIEKEEKYCEIIKDRLEKELSQLKLSI